MSKTHTRQTPANQPQARDSQVGLVYQAEHLVHRILDRSAEFPVIEIAGSRITLPVERKFSTIDSVQRYVDAVLGLNWVQARWPRAAHPVRVRPRAGQQSAHYEPASAVIAIPTTSHGQSWAMRELVLLHEIAHHLADNPQLAHHGTEFVSRYLELVEEIVGAAVALLLRVTLWESGVQVG